MIINGSKPDMEATVKNNERIAKSHHERGPYPCCGHDFWEQAKRMEFGDIVLCNRCHTYYAKIKHLPWLVKEKKWLSHEVTGYHTNHLDGNWFVPVPARVTD